MRRRGESPRQTRHVVPRAKNGGKDRGGERPLHCDGDRERTLVGDKVKGSGPVRRERHGPPRGGVWTLH